MTEGPDFISSAEDILNLEMSDKDIAKVQLIQPHMISVLTNQITADDALKLAEMEWGLLTEDERSETVRKGRAANAFAKEFLSKLGGKDSDND